MSFFQVDILTPNRVLAKKIAADNVELNTQMGQIGILPRHENLLAGIAPGTLMIQEGDKKKYFFVASGVIKISGETLTVLASEGLAQEEIDVEKEKTALANEREKMKALSPTSDEFGDMTYAIEKREAKIKTAIIK